MIFQRGHPSPARAPSWPFPCVSKENSSVGWRAWHRGAPFSAAQMKLLETFADQAVIAIENVRLFKELDERTNELMRSVEEMKALGEVGQAVSSSLDLETVLDAIVSRAVDLSGTDCGRSMNSTRQRKSFTCGEPPHGKGVRRGAQSEPDSAR